MTTAERMKARRKELGMSAEYVAEKLGYSPATVYRWERGDIEKMPMDILEPLAAILATTPAYLMGWDDDSPLPSNILPFPGTYKVPRLGRIACGDPITAEENIEDYDPVPNFVKADYTLVCRGDSMIGARIHDGDIVCIQQNAEVHSGDIAAVLVDEDEATLKRVRFQEDGIVLWPENPAYAPMAFLGADAQRVRIIGKATHFISSVR